MIEHPLPRTDETIRLMAERKVESDPTLVPYSIIFRLAGGYFGSTSRRVTLMVSGATHFTSEKAPYEFSARHRRQEHPS